MANACLMSEWPEIFVLRHGQTEWNASGRHQGRQNSDLTPKGRVQAQRQGEILRDAGLAARDIACFASPLGRAWDTAGLALDEIGKTATADERLVEIAFGQWEGLTHDEIDQHWPWSQDIQGMLEWTFSAVDGETLDAITARCRSFLDDLTGPSVIVTHGITSRVLRGLWLGLDLYGMQDLPGGQGNVHHLRDGVAVELT